MTEFLLDWAKPKTTVYNDFKTLRILNQGSMSFEQYVPKVKKLVNNCDIENAEAKESMIRNFIVTGASISYMTKEDTARIPDPQAQRTDTNTAMAGHATGVETATSHKNAQHMTNSA